MKTNKNFLKKLTAGILGFVMTLGVGAVGYAASAGETKATYSGTSPWDYTFANGDITTSKQTAKSLNNVSWSIDAATYSGYDGTKGAQIGSGSSPQKSDWSISANISEFGSSIQIDKVEIQVATASSGGIAWTIYAGDSSINDSVSGSAGATTSVATKTLTVSSSKTITSGEVKITLNSNSKSKAIYLKNIKVYFSTATVTTYKVTYKANGGIGDDAIRNVTKVNDFMFTAPEGKKFGSWNTKADGSGNVYMPNDSVTSELTLYAIYVNKPLEFLFDANSISSTTAASYNFDSYDVSYTVTSGKYQTDNSAITSSGFLEHNKILFVTNGYDFYNTTAFPGNVTGAVFYCGSGAGTAAVLNIKFGNSAMTSAPQAYDTTVALNVKGGTFEIDSSSIPDNATYMFVHVTGGNAQVGAKFYYEPVITHEVTISGGASSIYEGGTTSFTASCDQDGCDTITWESSDSTVASISNGKVIGLSAGQTTISATCAEGGSDSVTLTVQANALVLSPASISDAQKGGTGSITASLSGVSGETVSYVWESDQPSIVSVTGNTATATLSYVNGGTATITCTATVNDIEFSNSCSVTVLTKDPTASFNTPTTEGYTGISYDFTAVSANIDNGTWSWKVNGLDFTFDDDVDDDGYSIRYATFSEAGSYTITATCTGDGDATATATTTIVITASSSVLTIDQTQVVLQKGSSVSVTPTLVVTGSYADSTNITVTPSSGVTVNKTTTTSGSAVQITAGSTGGATKVTFSANGQDVECSISIPSTTIDKITTDDLEATGTTYETFSNVSKHNAVYSGQSQYNNGNIGIRTDSNSGFVSTTSGGIISKIIITWGGTTNGRSIDVYGKNTAYTSIDELFSTDKGKKLGSLVYNSSTSGATAELLIEGAYQYVGVRSNDKAITFKDISFVWTDPTPVESVTAGQDSISVAKGASSQLTWTVLPSDASNKAVEFSMNPVLTGVSVSDEGLVEVTKDATVGATSKITIASKENSSIKATVSLTILPTHLDNSKVLGRTGFDKFVVGQSFVGVRSSSNFVEAKYIDGTSVKSYNDGASLWNNVSCFVKNSNNEWETFSMSTPFAAADNGKTFKFVYTENGYTQTSNEFSISIDAVVIKQLLTLYYSGEGSSYASTHDFTKDVEYSATGTVTWSILYKPSQAEISNSGVLSILGAPSSGTSMEFTVRATCGNAKSECAVTLLFEPVTSISINETSLTEVAHGTTGTLSATVESKYALQEVKWESSDSATLSVTGQSGNKLKANYEAAESITEDKNVTVTCWADENGNNVKDPFEEAKQTQKIIKVVAGEIAVTSITLNPSSVEIWQDEIDDDNKSIKITPTLNSGATVKTLQWEIVEGSDNVVTLGSSAPSQTKQLNYTGNAGEAIIKATSMNEQHEQVYATLKVTVKESNLSSITADASASTVKKEFELNHEFGPSDYSGLSVKATFSSGNDKTVDLSNCVITCDTSKVGTAKVNISYTFNDVTQTTSYDVTIHAPSLNVVKKIVTESRTNPTEHNAGITSGSQQLNGAASISSIEVNEPSYGISALKFTCRYNKNIDNAVTMTVKIGQETIATENIGNNFDGTITINNTNNASGRIVLSFTNNTGTGTGHGTFYWTSLIIVDTGETIRTTTYSNNKMSDAMYAFIDEYSEDLSAGKWDTIFGSSEYAALSTNDKALFKDGVVSGTDDSGTKTSSKEFADFITKYDEIVKQYGPNFNVLERSVSYNNYTVEIDDMEIGILQAGSEYTLPTPSVEEGNKTVYYTADNQVFEAGDTINVYEDLALTKVEITDVEKVSVSTEANFKYNTDDNGAFSEVTQTTLRMYISMDADTYNFYVNHGYDFSIVIVNSKNGKSSTINSSSMSIKYDEEKEVYVFNVAFNIPAQQYSTNLQISLIASSKFASDETIKVTVNYHDAANDLYQAYIDGDVKLNAKQVAALKVILNIVG